MQFYTLSQTSLANSGSSVVEEYIPLWMTDGTTATNTAGSTGLGAFLLDGSSSANGASTVSSAKLHTLNSNWSNTQKFAFEATIYLSNTTGVTVYAVLWDMTSNTSVAQISTSSFNPIVLRSAQFILTPSHSYGVYLYNSSNTTTWTNYISDASLIVFGQ